MFLQGVEVVRAGENGRGGEGDLKGLREVLGGRGEFKRGRRGGWGRGVKYMTCTRECAHCVLVICCFRELAHARARARARAEECARAPSTPKTASSTWGLNKIYHMLYVTYIIFIILY